MDIKIGIFGNRNFKISEITTKYYIHSHIYIQFTHNVTTKIFFR